ncbi:sigma-70 family RNA polymerase sigma factor [Sneathiella sp. HT1-7]|uniref:sigma-70 family RNA polymerase sigma factor n=1 Tax=Sneathiella sp. HT1-7 TaxID=2887192 RepID=UPI001D1352E4|nr:sigma-70 family RNA polymerase sigma factor [Sneathiella sp. HT1-7]MCC3306407.1 sigma-70 family RNA polymerase sigma factor [Sneathiella sp. HT1-7]
MFNNQELTTEVSGLRNFARRLTQNNHDAEDLLQYTLLRAIEKKHLFQENTDLFKWTSKIMYNQFASDYRRKAKYETKYDPESYLEAESIEAPQDKQMELKTVNEAMNRLSHEHQEILILICVQGLSYQEVSDFLKIAIGTVRSRLSRARESLQQLLEAPTVH